MQYGAKFKVVGVIDETREKIGKRSGKPYGQIVVACGRVAHEFFVDPMDIRSGKYAKGMEVEVSGNLGRNGYDLATQDEEIKIAAQGASGAQQTTAKKSA